jgi:chaperone modulatory protein CbpM
VTRPDRAAARAVDALLDEVWLDLDQLCRAAGVGRPWVDARVAAGLLSARPLGPGGAWRFDAAALRRVRCMARLERDFDAVPELAALVADLEDEIAALRAALARARGA